MSELGATLDLKASSTWRITLCLDSRSKKVLNLPRHKRIGASVSIRYRRAARLRIRPSPVLEASRPSAGVVH